MREDSPDPARYAGDLSQFGKNVPRRVVLGKKYNARAGSVVGPSTADPLEERLKFEVEDGPGPGSYAYECKSHVVVPKIVAEQPWHMNGDNQRVVRV